MLKNTSDFKEKELYCYKREEEILLVFKCIEIDPSDESILVKVISKKENVIKYYTDENTLGCDCLGNRYVCVGFEEDEFYHRLDCFIDIGCETWIYLTGLSLLSETDYIEEL